MKVRIASYNIRKGGRPRRQFIAEVLRALDADVTVLQEATDPAVVRWLGEATGTDVLIAEGGRSVAVLSRLEATEARWHRVAHGRNIAEVGLASHGIRLLGVHLTAGLSGRGERRRAREIERVLEVACRDPGGDRTLIVGDLNAIAPGDLSNVGRLPTWIRILLRVDGGIGTGVIGRVLAEGFSDAFRRLHPGEPGSTMPAGAPSVRLDYAMLGAGLVPGAVGCAIGAADPELLVAASDHLPLVLDLELGGT